MPRSEEPERLDAADQKRAADGSHPEMRDGGERPESRPENTLDPERREPPATADEDQLITGERPEGDAIPASPGLRRLKITTALLFIAVILGFLIYFMLTHTEQH